MIVLKVTIKKTLQTESILPHHCYLSYVLPLSKTNVFFRQTKLKILFRKHNTKFWFAHAKALLKAIIYGNLKTTHFFTTLFTSTLLLHNFVLNCHIVYKNEIGIPRNP
jgi:hypothetical protein